MRVWHWDLSSALQATKSSTPLNPIIASSQMPSREKIKGDLETALTVARQSSASLGKFDRKLPDEKKLPQGKRQVRLLLL